MALYDVRTTVMNLPWLQPGDCFPAPQHAWGAQHPVPGLLAAGGALDSAHLLRAYACGIFPWFSPGQPILWWSPDPRMVLAVDQFRLHRSLRKTLHKFRSDTRCEIRIDCNFYATIRACAHTPRHGQDGTWIVPSIVAAYEALHESGHAHSVETWIDGQCVGGLYAVALGRAVFGESMFAHATDASKIALAALICLCRREHVTLIDCQQNTHHLASLGAREIPRADFLHHIAQAQHAPAISWTFTAHDWDRLERTIAADTHCP